MMKEIKIYCDHCGKELNTMKDYEELKLDWLACLYN